VFFFIVCTRASALILRPDSIAKFEAKVCWCAAVSRYIDLFFLLFFLDAVVGTV